MNPPSVVVLLTTGPCDKEGDFNLACPSSNKNCQHLFINYVYFCAPQNFGSGIENSMQNDAHHQGKRQAL